MGLILGAPDPTPIKRGRVLGLGGATPKIHLEIWEILPKLSVHLPVLEVPWISGAHQEILYRTLTPQIQSKKPHC